jgi:hypothetical protein
MPDNFDPYREALVMETKTLWPDEYDTMDWSEKQRLAGALHGDPQHASQLEYLRTHTGFCRQITVTEDDVQRLKM